LYDNVVTRGRKQVSACQYVLSAHRCSGAPGWLEPLVGPDVAEESRRRLQGINERVTTFGPLKYVRWPISATTFAGVVVPGETAERRSVRVETELFATGHSMVAVHGGAHGDPGDRRRDVLGAFLKSTGGTRTVVPTVASSAMRERTRRLRGGERIEYGIPTLDQRL